MGDPTDNELTRRALAAYFRSGYMDQPASGSSGPIESGGKLYVVLRNMNGVLAVYRVRTSGALKRLVRWPRELETW